MPSSVRILFLLGTALSLNACSAALDRLENVGKPPQMARIQDPTQDPKYHAISWPTPQNQAPAGQQYANSLWQPGARAFFRDQRAAREGDLLRVNIDIQDKAQVDNNTKAERKLTENLKTPQVFGTQNNLFGWLPGHQQQDNLLDVTNQDKHEGIGNINRQEKVRTQVAATVTQVMPNGNLRIDGKQEIRINYEVRELGIQGIVRREDIKSDNTIDLSQIAEARVTYGGRGVLDNIQHPRYGSEIVDILSPF